MAKNILSITKVLSTMINSCQLFKARRKLEWSLLKGSHTQIKLLTHLDVDESIHLAVSSNHKSLAWPLLL